jgi:hypothetical protein
MISCCFLNVVRLSKELLGGRFLFETGLDRDIAIRELSKKISPDCRRRTTRDRDVNRNSKVARYTSSLKYPPPPKPGTRGFQVRRPENFTPALGPTKVVRRVRRRWIAATNSPDQSTESLRITNTLADKPSA